ncbi:hypothetical protein [Streptomyces sp. ECR3.8]|uniref:hypothetical protein n=1 Tax=Streptomyces sp. ECR3.8 TaxID=3461009 RepID=UPI004041E6DD
MTAIVAHVHGTSPRLRAWAYAVAARSRPAAVACRTTARQHRRPSVIVVGSTARTEFLRTVGATA